MKQQSSVQKMLFWWGWILIVWSVYRFLFKTELPIWFDEFIAKPLVFVLPVFLYIKNIEKKKFLDRVGLKISKNFKEDFLLGLIFAVLFPILAVIIFKLPVKVGLFMAILIALATSLSEEILSRGFVLKRLYEESGKMFSASFFASILFFFLRVPILFTNQNLGGEVLLGIMLVDIVFSLLISVVFLMRKNLALPVLMHASYSVYLYMFFS